MSMLDTLIVDVGYFLNEVAGAFDKKGLEIFNYIFSIVAVFINLALLVVAWRALSTWRKELMSTEGSGVFSAMFDEVKGLHFDFIVLVGLQRKYNKLMLEADADRLSSIRGDERYSDPELLAALEVSANETFREELDASCKSYLMTQEVYVMKLISLEAFLIPLERYSLSKKQKNTIVESIRSLSQMSFEFFEAADKLGSASQREVGREMNKVNSKYLMLLMALDGAKETVLKG